MKIRNRGRQWCICDYCRGWDCMNEIRTKDCGSTPNWHQKQKGRYRKACSEFLFNTAGIRYKAWTWFKLWWYRDSPLARLVTWWAVRNTIKKKVPSVDQATVDGLNTIAATDLPPIRTGEEEQ